MEARQLAVTAAKARVLGRLIDFLRDWDEPTVVIFYGDHRPGLGLSDGLHTVYSELGMCENNQPWVWSAEEKKELYTTSYLIWSNDPDYLPAPAGTVRADSSNYLGLSVLKSAGLSLPLYWRVLDQLSETQLMYTYEYSLTRAGEYSLTPTASGLDQKRLERFGMFLGDAIYGKQYVTDRLWE